ncbi:MAG: nickel-responsive transcriptional regulator NikR, partial [Bacteroidota bacterium]|nr:nickel-responsive transcriptional regulator NikR [Bacteroidota bacterium]
MSVVRFGVSFEKEVLDALDEYVQENKFSNRSQALRQLVNRHIVEKKWQCNNRVAGSITVVYDHHRRDIANHLGETQLQYPDEILSVQRFTLNEQYSMEVIALN